MKTIIAIDPGASGGIATISLGRVDCYPMPETEGDILTSLRDFASGMRLEGQYATAIIEHQTGVMGPGCRVSSGSMFTFGRHFGFIVGCLQALGIPAEMVRPQKWQKALGLGSKKDSGGNTAWKNKLKAEAQRHYPGLKVTLKTADALLLLRYATLQ